MSNQPKIDTPLGQDAKKRFTVTAVQSIIEAIQEVGGREVFFAGTLNSDAIVAKVRVLARGHEGAVPAIFEGLTIGEVMIHNHPSGNIAPSEADVQLASIYGFHGHGVYIVDNAVQRVYVVVEPFIQDAAKKVDVQKLVRDLAPDGPLSRVVPQFEVRPQQEEMMEAVADAFNTDGIAVVEAPTGVGKTFAYLLPAISWAVANKERVVVSTKTINLQEQIIHKDVPVLRRALGTEFNAVLVKGRNNYLCWRRLNRALSEATLYDDAAEQNALRAIAEWAEKTEDGSLSDLPFVPPREVWGSCCSEADSCRLSNCPNPKRCFLGKARRDVAKADIIVVNHHMLFSDLAIKRELGNFSALAVLPSYRRAIIDEAHSVEDSATEYFGAEATRSGALALIGRFIRIDRGRERGLLPYLAARLIKDKSSLTMPEIEKILDGIDNQLQPALAAAREMLTAAFDALRHLTSERCGQLGREIKWRLTQAALHDEDLREIHAVYVLPAVEEVVKCAAAATALLELLKKATAADAISEPPFLTELYQLEAYRDRLTRLANTLAEGTSETLAENTVRWIEIETDNPNIVRIVRCPLEIAEPLADWVYANLRTLVMTSATLSVRKKFDYFNRRVGLDRVPERNPEGRAIDSPFDFAKQALLCIPTDIVAPDDRAFNDDTVKNIREILKITRGHAFVLFTSFYALDYAHRRLEQELKAAGITPLKQGTAARTRLLDQFRSDTASVLFATDSFWEGVDVPGDALQCVILTKLPFRVPTEPILQARSEAIEEAGGNPFMDYTVPQAVIKFRQGFGRLIRRKTDRGAIVVLDRRVLTKHYGKVFIESLPGVRVVSGPSQGVYMALQKFFDRTGV
ncbi:MAG: helicase C-terminal domain-containing protein [Candidatus Hydrogenedentes bacterium]|nr:helicase C-terminal domain-containing protein [Candidatus Hydrogenedentota bacterium]